MYRHFRDGFDWKFNFYVKCKLGKFSVQSVLVLSLLVSEQFGSVQCSENRLSGNAISNKSRNPSGRTVFEHGIFRHDKPWGSISPFPPNGNLESSTNDATHHTLCQRADGCPSADNIVPSPLPPIGGDHKDRYTYERFKRSVTTLNFHPRPRNESKNVGVKPLRIFKYITEEDILMKPHSSERQHVTIFQPIVTAAHKKDKNTVKGDTSDISFDINASRQQVIGGTLLNLNLKLDKNNDEHNITSKSNKIINSNEGIDEGVRNKNNIKNADSESKSAKISKISSPKPENILVYKPSLVIRKGKIASLIPSGNHPPKQGSLIQSGGGNSMLPSITAATTALGAKMQGDESADPNSSTVNDRSLIHHNMYFDSVVMLNEEGQKQLYQQQQQQTVEAHHENARKSSSSNSEKYDNDDVSGNGDDEIKSSESTTTPSSSFSSKSNVNGGSNNGTNVDATKGKTSQKKISPSLSTASSEPNASGNGEDDVHIKHTVESSSSSNNNNKASDPDEKLIQQIDATITGNNKDKIVVKVVKSKKSKNSKKSKTPQQRLDEDDIDEDGSERSRRSPFKVPVMFQAPGNNAPRFSKLSQLSNNDGHQQLTRAALFRTAPGVTRIRTNPIITKKIIPRIFTAGPASPFMNPGKITVARTILPMKPMPVMHTFKQTPPNLALVPGPGPVGPGPVGPPIAAIKVTSFNALNNVKGKPSKLISSPLISGKDLMGDASRTVYSYKPLTEDMLLNQAASSYYSPTYKKFRKRFHNQIANIMDSQRDLEDTIHRYETSRYPGRHSSVSKHRPRTTTSRNHRDRDYDRDREISRYHVERDRHDRYDRDERHDKYDRHERHDRNERGSRDRSSHSQHRSGQNHPHSRHTPPSRGKKLGPRYAYPKNAENIQDILKYFDKEAPRFGGGMSNAFEKEGPMNPNRQQSVLPGGKDVSLPAHHPKLADLSGEFRDVHASLLKDIREFAKRPNFFGSSDKSEKSQGHPFDSREIASPFDPIDEIFGKAKPVRELIKPDLYSLENIRERIAFKRGKLHGRHRDKDRDTNSNHHDDHHNDDHRPHSDVDDDGFYDSNRPSRHNSDGGHSIETTKNSLFSKEEHESPSTYSKRDKYNKESDDSHAIFPSSHFREKDSIKENINPYDYHSAEFTKSATPTTSNKPIVLKRPNEPFRIREAEPKKKPEHDYFWNTFPNGFEKPPAVNYEAPLVLKSPTPSVLQPLNPYSTFNHPVGAATAGHALPKPVSVEDEDIVEIHTGGPGNHMSGISSYPASATNSNHFKQEKLKKMYMDVLQQKLQLEAALMHHPQQSIPTMQSPNLHHHIPSMHTSASLHPQHNPLQITRMGHAPQLAAYQTSSPSTGLAGMTRRKKPMRMKIHIYPNGNDGLEQGLEAANLLAGGFGPSGFSASNPPGVVAVPPPKDISLGKPSDSAIPSGPPGPLPTSPSGYGGQSLSGPMGPVPKNKNVVLHLHVHRRNDMMGPLELETEGSAPVPATLKPLTYTEIFDEQMKKSEQQRDSHLSNHRQTEEEEEPSQSTQDTQETGPNDDNSERGERDKSVSMEAPIHDDKIEDVFHSIMKFRKKPDNRKKRS